MFVIIYKQQISVNDIMYTEQFLHSKLLHLEYKQSFTDVKQHLKLALFQVSCTDS